MNAVKGIVYKVVDKREPSKILYVGSTVMTLAQRWYKHKSEAKTSNSKWNTYLREQGEEHFQILPLMGLECETIEDLRKLEEVYRKGIQPLYNDQLCHQSDEEYKEYHAEYRQENKEEIAKKKAKKNICECGCETSHQHQARHRKSEKHKNCLTIRPRFKARMAREAFLTALRQRIQTD